MTIQKIYIASDHAGVKDGNLKRAITQYLVAKGYAVEDLGAFNEASVDYPDYAHKLAEALRQDATARGILICGSGQGIAMAANKHRHIRAAVISANERAVELATLARQHNDANVLSFGARFVTPEAAITCTEAFLTTAREAGRHADRVAKITPRTTQPQREPQ